MIPPKKSAWLGRWFGGVAEGRFAQTFHAVRVCGLSRLFGAATEGPVLVVSNHTSFWDPMFAIWLCNRLAPRRGGPRLDGYALMDARNLRRLPFLGRLGGFGVELDDPADRARSVEFAASLLQGKERLLWIFPQGAERPLTEPELGFYDGAARVAAQAAEAPRVVPVAFRYEFGSEEKPTCWVSIGEPLDAAPDAASGRDDQEAAVGRELTRIDRVIRGVAEGDRTEFEVVLKRGPSWAARLAERVLAWLSRYR